MPSGKEPRFRVIYSESVRQAFRTLHSRAVQHGLGEAVLAAAKAMNEQLGTDPRTFGDPNYSLQAMRLDVYVRVLPPLVVHYAVHKTKDLVIVRRILPAPGAGF
jgi:hypothetical protein